MILFVIYSKVNRNISLEYTREQKEYNIYSMYLSPANFVLHNRAIDDLRKQYKETVVLKVGMDGRTEFFKKL